MGLFTLGSEAHRLGRMQQLRDSFRGVQHVAESAAPIPNVEMAAPIKPATQIIEPLAMQPLVEHG